MADFENFPWETFSDEDIVKMSTEGEDAKDPEFVAAAEAELTRRADASKEADKPAEPEAEQPKSSKGGRGLRAELEKLEARRAELKRTKKEDLNGDEFAQVKTRIAEIKAQLGE